MIFILGSNVKTQLGEGNLCDHMKKESLKSLRGLSICILTLILIINFKLQYAWVAIEARQDDGQSDWSNGQIWLQSWEKWRAHIRAIYIHPYNRREMHAWRNGTAIMVATSLEPQKNRRNRRTSHLSIPGIHGRNQGCLYSLITSCSQQIRRGIHLLHLPSWLSFTKTTARIVLLCRSSAHWIIDYT